MNSGSARRFDARWLLVAAGLVLGAPVATGAVTEGPVTATTLDVTRGAVLSRPEGGHVQLVIHEAHLELWFFDAAGRRVPASWDHGVVVYRSPAHRRETTLLNPTDDHMALRSVETIDGPFAFHAHVSLFPPSASTVARSYDFDFDRGTGRT